MYGVCSGSTGDNGLAARLLLSCDAINNRCCMYPPTIAAAGATGCFCFCCWVSFSPCSIKWLYSRAAEKKCS